MATNTSGQRFGMLVAVARAGTQCRQATWLCSCDCGNTSIAMGQNLRRGRTMSCGCQRGKATRKHGESRRTPEYEAWKGMNSRCNTATHKRFAYYGARGITVCERWQSFENFLADMGRRPSPKHSLDRIDVNGNYEPTNCRWTTQDIQLHNRRPASNTGLLGITYCSSRARYRWAVRRNFQKLFGYTEDLAAALAAQAAATSILYGAEA